MNPEQPVFFTFGVMTENDFLNRAEPITTFCNLRVKRPLFGLSQISVWGQVTRSLGEGITVMVIRAGEQFKDESLSTDITIV